MSETRDQRPPMPQNFKWYSVCSMHYDYKWDCHTCNVGQWINDSYRELEHWLFERDKNLWQEWANRPEQRKFLEDTFPGLRKK